MKQKRLSEIEQRKREIFAEVDGADEARMTELGAEVDTLRGEEEELRAKLSFEGKLGAPLAKPEGRDSMTEMERRGKALREERATTIGSGQLIQPKGNQTDINGPIGGSVSSIIDLVKVTPCANMSSYEVPYLDSDATAAKTGEGETVAESTPAFAYAVIKPVTVATYSEITRESMKLSNIDYYNTVVAAALKALRKVVSEYIIASDATSSPSFVGILAAGAISDATDKTLTAIDERTLRAIAMSYGGDDDIVGGAALFLTKKDLIAFGDVRGANEKGAIYEITPDTANTNTGIIKDGGLSVRYCINNSLPPMADAATGKCVMVYGVPTCYEIGLFSDYTIRVSEEAAFRKRMIAVLGEVMIGGNVTVKNGFVLVKKA